MESSEVHMKAASDLTSWASVGCSKSRGASQCAANKQQCIKGLYASTNCMPYTSCIDYIVL